MDDDFNTAKALAAFFEVIKTGNVAVSKKANIAVLNKIRGLIIELGNVLGLHLERVEERSQDIEQLILERNLARKNKDWKHADEIRSRLNIMGVILQDYPTGTTWSFTKKSIK